MTASRHAALMSILAGLSAAGCSREAAPAADDGAQRMAVVRFWARFGEATAARARGDVAGAARAYEAALALEPRHEDALYYLGQAQRQLGRPIQARETLARLLRVNPVSARGHLALGALLASPDAREPADLEEAEGHLRRAHGINGEETGPMLRLGEVLLVRGALAEAGRWFESASNTNAQSVEAAFLAGYVRWESGDRAGARRFLDRAARAGRLSPPPRGVMGEGDRKMFPGQAAPFPTLPMGRTLFGDYAARVETDSSGRAMHRLYQAVREARRRLDKSCAPQRRSSLELGPIN